MSEFRQPTQKGTEIFPSVVQKPCVVRFDGVEPGSVEAAQLMRQLDAQISQFHAKSSQGYELSPIPFMTRRATIDGLQMMYTNNQGTEVIRVRIPPVRLEKLLPSGTETVPVDVPWDTILVDIEIDDMDDVVGQAMVAAYVVPEKPGAPQFAASNGDSSVDAALSFATADEDLVGTQSGTTWFGSLKIDITKMRGRDSLKVDLYAGIAKVDSSVNTYPTAFRVRPYTVSADDPGDLQFTLKDLDDYAVFVADPSDSEYNRVISEFPELSGMRRMFVGDDYLDNDTGVISAALISAVGAGRVRSYFAQFGDEAPSTITTEWPGGPTGAHRTVTSYGTTNQNTDPLGPVLPALPTPVYANVRLSGTDGVTYWMPAPDTDPHNRDHPAHLRTLFFRQGDPLDVVSKIETAVTESYRWEISAKYPARSPMNEVPTTVTVRALRIPLGVGTADHYGLRRLGTFKLDLEHAVAKWESA